MVLYNCEGLKKPKVTVVAITLGHTFVFQQIAFKTYMCLYIQYWYHIVYNEISVLQRRKLLNRRHTCDPKLQTQKPRPRKETACLFLTTSKLFVTTQLCYFLVLNCSLGPGLNQFCWRNQNTHTYNYVLKIEQMIANNSKPKYKTTFKQLEPDLSGKGLPGFAFANSRPDLTRLASHPTPLVQKPEHHT